MTSNIQSLRAQVADELKRVELRTEFLKGQLAALDQLAKNEKAQPIDNSSAKQLLNEPPISVGQAIRQAMIALREFTKDDIINWVRSSYPKLQFSERSWGRPLREMMEKGEVLLLRPNSGNKTQAVYGLKRRD